MENIRAPKVLIGGYYWF